MNYQRHKNAGLTLIELMIALALSLVLTAAIIQLFISNKTTFKLSEGNARVQETGRFAVEMLLRDIRMAGFGGCLGRAMPIPKIITKSYSGGLGKLLTDQKAIFGIDSADASDTDLNSVTFGAKVGTDIIMVQGVDDAGVGLVGNLVAVNANIQISDNRAGFKANDNLLITDCELADYFAATNVSKGADKTTIAHSSASNTTNFLSKAYGQDAMVFLPSLHSYFIRDTGRTDASGSAIFALYRRDASGANMEFLEGVNDLQIIYGVDNDNNGSVDVYQTADELGGIDSGNWENVVSVRLSLTVRTIDYLDPAPLSRDFEFVAAIRNRTL